MQFVLSGQLKCVRRGITRRALEICICIRFESIHQCKIVSIVHIINILICEAQS